MCFMCQAAYTAGAAIIAVTSSGVPGVALADSSDTAGQGAQQAAVERLVGLQSLPEVLNDIKAPQQEQPEWYRQQVAAEEQAAAAANQAARRPNGSIVFTYTIRTDGAQSSLAAFSALAHETLNDPRGWSQLGVRFEEVPSGGQFNLILADASRLPAYSSGCSAEWSCRVGVSVIINEMRWNGATPAWNAAGGGLRDYRHMVINHEVGHWLGHGHRNCSAPGAYAPLMLQQSIDLQGCKFNPWPLPGELWSSRL